MKLGERIKELRTERKISQADLATATGLSKSAIARWELDETEPTASALISLANFFEVSADYLLGLADY